MGAGAFPHKHSPAMFYSGGGRLSIISPWNTQQVYLVVSPPGLCFIGCAGERWAAPLHPLVGGGQATADGYRAGGRKIHGHIQVKKT